MTVWQRRLAVILPAVGFGVERFARRAVEYLRGRGRRRIAHVRGDAVHVDPVAFSKELKRLGGEVRPYWVHLVPVGVNFRSASEIVNLLMQLEGGKRPDALVIHDDNMIEPVTAGLLRAGVKVPDDLEIVAHTNWPAPVASQLPMTRLGFDPWGEAARLAALPKETAARAFAITIAMLPEGNWNASHIPVAMP